MENRIRIAKLEVARRMRMLGITDLAETTGSIAHNENPTLEDFANLLHALDLKLLGLGVKT